MSDPDACCVVNHMCVVCVCVCVRCVRPLKESGPWVQIPTPVVCELYACVYVVCTLCVRCVCVCLCVCVCVCVCVLCALCVCVCVVCVRRERVPSRFLA